VKHDLRRHGRAPGASGARTVPDERYPGYDVLAKQDTPSWDAATRRAIAERLAVRDEPRFLGGDRWLTLRALCDGVLPQPPGGAHVPLAAYVDRKLADNRGDGYRPAKLPPLREAWLRGLAALEAEARAAFAKPFHLLPAVARDQLIGAMQRGELKDDAWGGMPCEVFFADRAAPDIVRAYYAHPQAWNEIGFGGPASPRGYVRLGFNERDPWEAADALTDGAAGAWRKNRRVGR